MSQANAYEQYMLELVNKARNSAGVQPLAFNTYLNSAAELHSEWMLSTDIFSHTGDDGSSAVQRMKDAGYVFSGTTAYGENIGWRGTTSPSGYQDEVEALHGMLMNSSGHRANILKSGFREIGIGVEPGNFKGWDAAVVTQSFALTASNPFLTGVAFDDKDGDRAYDVGEGLGGVSIKVTNSSTGWSTSTTAGSASA